MQKNFTQVLWLFCGLGFVLGIVYENISHSGGHSLGTFFGEEAMQQIATKTIAFGEYFFYVLRVRVRMLLPVLIIGLIKWKKVFVNLFLLWIGFLFGVLLANAIIWQGIAGIVICLVLLIPHMPFYAMGYYIILFQFYRHTEQRWNVRKIIVCITIFLIGIVLEVYINPWLVKGILNLF